MTSNNLIQRKTVQPQKIQQSKVIKEIEESELALTEHDVSVSENTTLAKIESYSPLRQSPIKRSTFPSLVRNSINFSVERDEGGLRTTKH